MGSRVRRWAAALLLAGAAGAVIFQERSGENGSGWIAGQVQHLLSGPDRTVTIGRVEIGWSLDVAIHDLAIADGQGIWLDVDRVTLDWAPGALLRREVRIGGLDVNRMALERLPAGQPEPPPGEEPFGLPRLPDLPVGIDLQKLTVGQLDLGAPLLGGEPASLRIDGSARLERRGAGVAANLAVGRLDRPGSGKLALDHAPGADRLDLDLAVEEPEGGVIARAAGIPGLPPVTVVLRGSGPLPGWRGRLDGSAGDMARVGADATIRGIPGADGAAGYGVTISGDAALARPPDRLLDRRIAALIGDGIAFRAEAALEPARRIALTGARVTLAAGTLELSGTYRFDPPELDFDYALEADAGSSLRILAPEVGWEHVRLSGKAAGPVDAPTVAADLAIEGIAAADPRIARLAGPEVRISGSAVILPGTGEIRIDGLRVGAAIGTLSATALVRDWQAVDARVALDMPDLKHLADIAGVPLEGAAVLGADLTGGDQAVLVRADVTGTATGLRTGRIHPAVDALVGREVDLAGLVTVGTDGSIDLSSLRIDGRHVELTASATFRDGALDAGWRASLPRLDVLAEPLETAVAGSSVVDGTATGPLDALEVRADLAGRDLVLSGRAVPRADLSVRATLAPGTSRGTLDASAVVGRQPFDARTAFALEGQRLGLTGLSLGAGRDRITGAVGVALDRMTATGRLAGDIGDLGVFSVLAGRTLGGSGRLEVRLDDARGRQAATAALGTRNLSVAGPEGPVLAASRLDLNADVSAARGGIRFDGRLDGTGVAVAGAPAQPVRVRLAGGLTREGTLRRLGVDKLDGAYAGEPFRLAGPATAAIGPDIFEVRNLLLTSREARVALDGGLVRNALDGTATLTRIPLALASLVAPDHEVTGRLDGKAVFGGSLADPRADLDLRAADVTLRGGEAAGLTGIDIGATGRWRNGRLALDGKAATRRRDGVDMRFQADLPLVLRREPLTVDLPRNVPVSGALRGHVELAILNDLLADTGDQAQGRLDVNLDLAGSLGDPRLGGDARIAGGRYENRAAGAVISGITLRLRGDGRRLTVDRFDGRTPGGGTVEVSGSVNVDPADPRAFDLSIEAGNAQLVQTDIVTAKFDTLLSLTGPLDAPLLRGPVTIRHADIRIPERMPPGVVEIQVEEINRPGGPAPAEQPTASPLRLRLDMTVKAENRIFVRGRGLAIELSSDATVGGTAAKPIPGGGLRLVNGTLDLLTTWFEFTRADIVFTGDGSADPMLDVSAQARAADITARVVVTGRASAPRITLTSTPELPQDEILARVLFSKPFSNLSAIEAVQIAQSVSRLTGIGGAPGVIDKVRGTLGIDRLELLSGKPGEGLSGTGVAAGRYVSRDVYVGAEQRVGEAGSRAVVEITLTRNLRLRTDVGTNSGASIGVLYEWEY
ncbi:translocation/assembly module TamB domain-containing protein (plasmid) [Skermanella mucosa]|uniref:translocation/assembly module TamB domain-containing protein n=1 Tax=Skermanella mucosa TaxID=1789672 RepID=UPI00192B871F|nr:translocation/assembly module TamB domain-containing protein [Skermanella mucosa]UEM24636.1 translocation/assembly module TamB domain-containing protein [Skermanella mucosa]